MRYIFPRCRFADTLTLEQQSRKMLQEAYEVESAILPGWDGTDAEWHEEILDLLHACETACWILEKEHGPGYVHDLRDRVALKNLERGYYGDL